MDTNAQFNLICSKLDGMDATLGRLDLQQTEILAHQAAVEERCLHHRQRITKLETSVENIRKVPGKVLMALGILLAGETITLGIFVLKHIGEG